MEGRLEIHRGLDGGVLRGRVVELLVDGRSQGELAGDHVIVVDLAQGHHEVQLRVAGTAARPSELFVGAGTCVRWKVRVGGLTSVTKMRAFDVGNAPSGLCEVAVLRHRFLGAWAALALATSLMAVGGPVTWRPVLTALLIQFFLAGVIVDRLLAGGPADGRCRNPD